MGTADLLTRARHEARLTQSALAMRARRASTRSCSVRAPPMMSSRTSTAPCSSTCGTAWFFPEMFVPPGPTSSTPRSTGHRSDIRQR